MLLCPREKTEQQLLHMKAQHLEAQRSLHLERSHLQEQSEQHRREVCAWETRVQQLEQEARRERLLSTERWSEEQAQICSKVAQERKELEEEHQEEVRKLGEHIQFMEAQVELASRAEEELLVLQKQLEDKLEEMCVQLEDNTVSMKAQDALIQHLTTELHAKEKEMEIRNEKEQKLCNKHSQLEQKLKAEREKKQELLKHKELLQKETDRSIQDLKEKLVKEKEKEQELLDRVSQLTKELENWRTKTNTWQKEIKMMQGSSSHLSTVFGEQKVQLREQEKELVELQENLAKTQEALKTRDDDLTRQASELNAVEMERDRLSEELRGQCKILKQLQTQVNSLSEEWDQMHMMEQKLQGSLYVEQGKVEPLQARLNSEQEETRRLEQENSSYRQLVDQLSSQFVEMEAESTKLKDNADKLALELRNKDNQMLELNHQLEAKAKEMDLLWNEVQLKMNLFKNVTHLSGHFQLLTSQLEDKEQELCSLREDADNTANQLQQSLMDSQTELQQMEEAFESEKSHMKEQLLEMEGLVMALEEELANPHRFVVLQLIDDRRNRNQTNHCCIDPIAVSPVWMPRVDRSLLSCLSKNVSHNEISLTVDMRFDCSGLMLHLTN